MLSGPCPYRRSPLGEEKDTPPQAQQQQGTRFRPGELLYGPGTVQMSTTPLQTTGHLNQELVKQGWCWWYRKYAPADTVLEQLEAEAREAKKGLWADLQPVPPWEWRKRR